MKRAFRFAFAIIVMVAAIGGQAAPETTCQLVLIAQWSTRSDHYRPVVDGEINGQKIFSDDTLKLMTTTISDGPDRVFEILTAFSAGFMKDARHATRRIFGRSPDAFGHPGAGGSHAFADPENKISFAYVMNQMEQSLLPNEKSLRLVDAIYR